jgi:hypothetical protein
MLPRLSMLLVLGLLAGSAHAQERDWTLDASEDDAYLIFGVPESDDVGVSLWCRIGQGAINLFLPVPTRLLTANTEKASPVTIAAGKETATFRGKVDYNRLASVSSVEAEITVGHPLIPALREADRFSIKAGEADIIFPLYNADIDGLLALCRKP